MKKFTKVMSLVVVLALTLLAPVFAGCAKTYTVNLSIVGGNNNGGMVLYKNTSISAYGNTAVKGGEKYEVYIAPHGGYYIDEILIDGEAYSKAYNSAGADLSLEITKDTNIQVTFALHEYTFYVYTVVRNQAGEIDGEAPYLAYPIRATHFDTIYFEEFGVDSQGRGRIYYFDSFGAQKFIDPAQGFVVNSGNYKFYTELTADEIEYILRPEHEITVVDATAYGVDEGPFGTITRLVEGNQYVDATEESVMLKEGEFIILTITPNAGYKVEKILINGNVYTAQYNPEAEFSITVPTNNTTDLTYSIYFEEIEPAAAA